MGHDTRLLNGLLAVAILAQVCAGQTLEPIHYTVRIPQPRTHYVEVEATVPSAGQREVELKMAIWTPYVIREFARNLEEVAAEGGGGRSLQVEKYTKNRWRIQTGGAKGMLLYAGDKIGNATIRVVYKMSNPKGNSGVFIRIPMIPDSETYAIHHGIEVQIDDQDDEWHCTGTLYSMTKALARASKPSPEWNTMEITLDGLRTIVHVNGVLVTDYDGVGAVPERKKQFEPERGPRPETGFIALQNHDPTAVVTFKEISLEPLKMKKPKK